ncbi:Alpha/Beta hydrolase protein [Paraphoma chrysanthemicola]|nr:Alpha/Beta hydrolase protein [Paraphoma chrysanthemicola]
MPTWKIFSRKPASQEIGPVAETNDDYGLDRIFDGENAAVDIIFVHGLTGNRRSTWTHGSSVFWPRDLLAIDLPKTRIFTFGYDADVARLFRTAGSNTIRDHGKSLAQDLAVRRTTTNTADRPIIFVAHSLGGLVVEQALLIARGSSEAHVKAFLPATAAIVFMGTPHMGSSKADWATPLTKLLNLLRRSNSAIVATLEPGSEMLAAIQQDFHTMLEDRRRNEDEWFKIFCFYEEIAYESVGFIVPKTSAILREYPHESIHANHSDMTKFSGKGDSGYIRVEALLRLWIKQISEESADGGGHSEEMQTASQGKSGGRQGVSNSISSGGGAVFMGNVSAGRDFNYR